MQLGNNTVIVNRDRAGVINDDGPELESPTASGIIAGNGLIMHQLDIQLLQQL